MAGEDPGTSTVAVLLEAIQRAWAAATGSIKAVAGGIMDIVKTGMFISWRRKMMQGQMGPDLVHGQQSLKDLRLHEQVGARIVSVEIGDFKAMDALCEELKRMEVDFAITEHDHQYTLHYKESNEQDILHAQQAALEKLYGDPNQAADERETPSDPDQREEHGRDGDEGREQDEREDRENERRDDREERDRSEQEQDERERTDDSSDQDRSADEQQRQEQEREAEQREREQQEQEEQERQSRDRSQDQSRPEQAVPAGTVLTGAAAAYAHEQAREQGSGAQSTGLQREAGPERASQMEAPQPQHRQENAAALKPNQKFEPLEDLIKQARERARAKNMARKDPDRDMRLDRNRSLTRERARSFEPGH